LNFKNNIPINLFRNFFTVVFVVYTFISSYAQIPIGYYNNAIGLSGETLKTALYNIIKTHTTRTYDNLWTDFQTTDVKPTGKVWDMYSNCTFTFVTDQDNGSGGTAECQKYNREHSFPKSWFGGEVAPMYTDLFHLIPTDKFVNNARGNYAFGQVTSANQTFSNGGKIGNNSYGGTFTGVVYEPTDEYKGDLARNYFYMVTCYENQIASGASNDANGDAMLDGTAYPCFETWAINMLLAWHTADPVSQKEIDRNNAVYGIQGNRNPYIDHPEYVNYIWAGDAPVLAEPSNYPTDFSARNIKLQWTDATTGILPEKYLIRMSTTGFNNITAPVDGLTYTDSTTDLNINYGVQLAWYINLEAETTYYFKIYSYTGSGISIDYKTDGIIPEISKTIP
jgi:endonuclease I